MLVSQSLLVLSASLGVGLLSAAAMARGASTKARAPRALQVSASVIAIFLIAYVIDALNLRFNFTQSVPVGIYRLAPPSARMRIQRGALVAVCLPAVAAELGRLRGYLSLGVCPHHTEPLLKIIAAVAGDYLAISATGVAVDGCFLPNSRALTLDAAGRPLRPWPEGRYRLRRGQLWLYADNARSWDSRYWGPVPAIAVVGSARQIVVVNITFRARVPQPDCGPALRGNPGDPRPIAR